MNPEREKPVVVRLPPSPTGYLHIGNVRTMIFNYLFAKKQNGKIILRIEDTDRERSRPEYEDYIIASLAWLGIDYDEYHRQSDRTTIYRKHLEQLISEDTAYISEEQPTKEAVVEAAAKGKTLRTSVIRFRNPNTKITFTDQVLGEITVDTSDLGDFVIAKDLETPIYHFTVVVDDFLMGVTHVIRGNDHVANTPRQILLLEALGAIRPTYVHVPLVLGADGKKLSKRHAATATLDYRDAGYTPDAVLNFLALLGWNPGTEQEIFTRQDLIDVFSLERLQKGSAVFNEEKLRWVNRQHLLLLDDATRFELAEEYLATIPHYDPGQARRIIPQIFERIDTLGDLSQQIAAGEYDFYFEDPEYPEPANLVWKKSDTETALRHLEHITHLLDTAHIPNWQAAELKEIIWPYAESEGRGDVLWPLRFALSGKPASPDPFTLLELIGKEQSLGRIKRAQEALGSML